MDHHGTVRSNKKEDYTVPSPLKKRARLNFSGKTVSPSVTSDIPKKPGPSVLNCEIPRRSPLSNISNVCNDLFPRRCNIISNMSNVSGVMNNVKHFTSEDLNVGIRTEVPEERTRGATGNYCSKSVPLPVIIRKKEAPRQNKQVKKSFKAKNSGPETVTTADLDRRKGISVDTQAGLKRNLFVESTVADEHADGYKYFEIENSSIDGVDNIEDDFLYDDDSDEYVNLESATLDEDYNNFVHIGIIFTICYIQSAQSSTFFDIEARARDRFRESTIVDLKITLKVCRSESGRENHIGPSDEVAGIMVGDLEETEEVRDIIIEKKMGGFERVTSIHPKLMALHYPILFPNGEDGYHKDIYYCETVENNGKTRRKCSMKDFYSYKLHVRHSEGMTLRLGGRLFQQYLLEDIKKKSFFGTCLGVMYVVEFQKRGLPHEACSAYGLLDDDKEWHEVLTDCAKFGVPQQIRELFVRIIVNCQVADLQKLWMNHWNEMSDDILVIRRKLSRIPDLVLSTEEIQFFVLTEIDKLLRAVGKSLKSYPQMPQPPPSYLEVEVFYNLPVV
ncbi:hypothetical protein POM88_000932 [Heracleum sosnowskyi]|uniref:Uncharacterized protein n=1 Tax=Heracleum sosnowskyi TaxID=360622 RepID=A0AAD8N9W0_9APIA|nr:hypothetical protein POM88_000932 [Heracleum sosnowskyi]